MFYFFHVICKISNFNMWTAISICRKLLVLSWLYFVKWKVHIVFMRKTDIEMLAKLLMSSHIFQRHFSCEKIFNKNVPFTKRFTTLWSWWPIGQLWFAVNLFTLEKLIKNSKSIDSQTHWNTCDQLLWSKWPHVVSS